MATVAMGTPFVLSLVCRKEEQGGGDMEDWGGGAGGGVNRSNKSQWNRGGGGESNRTLLWRFKTMYKKYAGFCQFQEDLGMFYLF